MERVVRCKNVSYLTKIWIKSNPVVPAAVNVVRDGVSFSATSLGLAGHKKEQNPTLQQSVVRLKYVSFSVKEKKRNTQNVSQYLTDMFKINILVTGLIF